MLNHIKTSSFRDIKMKSKYIVIALMFFTFGAKSSSDFSQLETLFSQWRSFEVAPLHELAPDYRQQTFKKRHATWAQFKAPLLAFDK